MPPPFLKTGARTKIYQNPFHGIYGCISGLRPRPSGQPTHRGQTRHQESEVIHWKEKNTPPQPHHHHQRLCAQLLSTSPGCVSSWSERSRPLHSCHFTSGHPHSLLGICPQISGLPEEPASHNLLAISPSSSPHPWLGGRDPME